MTDEERGWLVWGDAATGLLCAAARVPGLGCWVGYAGVPPGHQLHGIKDATDLAVEAHGGLTYAGAWPPLVPQPADVPPDWWFYGFDCGHAGDDMPELAAELLRRGFARHPLRFGVYRDLAYVRGECARLAAQLAALGAAWPDRERYRG